MRYRFMRFPGGKAKALTFSYDDGCKQDIKTAEILSSHNMKGTFNLNGYGFRGDKAITEEEVKTHLLDKGHEIAAHGYSHIAEGVVSSVIGIRDVLDCRLELERKFKQIIRGFAYPDLGIRYFTNGTDYERVKNYLSDLGIVYARTLRGDNNSFTLPSDWYAWMPTAHHDTKELFQWADEFINLDLSPMTYHPIRYPRLFYIWGHSYEFDNNNNWDRLESICEKFASADDIWFATNIQIYDYVKAYDSLIFSADNTIVHNPAAVTVWFDCDGRLYSVAPNETINI